MCFSLSVVSNSLWPLDHSQSGFSVHGDSPSKNFRVGWHSLVQKIFLIQGLNPGLLHCRQILYCLSHQKSPYIYISKIQFLTGNLYIFVHQLYLNNAAKFFKKNVCCQSYTWGGYYYINNFLLKYYWQNMKYLYCWIFYKTLFFEKFYFYLKIKREVESCPIYPLSSHMYNLSWYQHHLPEWDIFLAKGGPTLTSYNHPKFITYLRVHSRCLQILWIWLM